MTKAYFEHFRFAHSKLFRAATFVIHVSIIGVLIHLIGCSKSGETVRVTGQLMKDGKPYSANLSGKEPDTFAVDFVGTIKDHQYRYGATIKGDGSFRVDGADGRGIPRGHYKITVLHSGFLGAGGDRLNTRFAEAKTPLAIDLSKNTRLTIDLGLGTVGE